MHYQPLKLTHLQCAKFYAELCDVIARENYHIDEDDPYLHTSSEARRIAMLVLERLANCGYVEYR